MSVYEISKARRVLLMYITKVSGHRAATVAIEQAIKLLDPTVEVMSINGFGYTYPLLEKVVNQAYMSIIKSTPKVWDFLYDNPKVFKRSEGLKKYLHKTSHQKLDKLFKEFSPDTVICTQAFPCGMIADYKMAHHLPLTLVGVLTDYAPHSYWINEGVDHYVVPSEDARFRFISKGVSPQKVKLFGIPIHANFSIKKDRKNLAKKLGVDLDRPIILIMGGGQGLGPIKQVVKSLLKMSLPSQVMVTAGINKKLIKWLKRFPVPDDKKLVVFDYVNYVEDLMEVAHLIITKPGGMTTSECLAKGLPMVIVDPLPGQEMRNTDFLLQNGIAIHVDVSSDVGEEVELLLRKPEQLERMRLAALSQGHPDSALNIAKLILNQPYQETRRNLLSRRSNDLGGSFEAALKDV